VYCSQKTALETDLDSWPYERFISTNGQAGELLHQCVVVYSNMFLKRNAVVEYLVGRFRVILITDEIKTDVLFLGAEGGRTFSVS